MPRKKKGVQISLPVLIVGILLLTFLFAPNILTDAASSAGDFVASLLGKKAGGPVTGEYYGSCSFVINENDYLAGASASPTNGAYTLFHEEPKSGSAGESITASGTTTDIWVVDEGYVWFEIYGGDDFYLVEDAFKSANSHRISTTYWTDWDGDGSDDFICKVYVGDVGVIGQGLTPTCTITLPLLDLDKSGLVSDNPTNQTSVGTTEVVKQITWKFSGITAEDGVFLTRLFFATNDTREGEDVRCEELTLSGGWVSSSGCKTYWASPIDHDDNTYTAWYIKPSDYLEYHQGERIWRDTNEADTLYISLNVRCTLETSDVAQIIVYAYFVDSTGATVSVSREVTLTA